MVKKLIATLAVIFASIYFAFIGMWIAPYAVGVLHSAITYNIVLGVILSVLVIITIILFCKKRLRIYSLLSIPHIIALGLIMLHVGNNLTYMDGGYIRVKYKPFGGGHIRTTSGRVIFDSWDWTNTNISGKTIFYKWDSSTLHHIYDDRGNCILIKPIDDTHMGLYSRGFWTKKKLRESDNVIHRIRLFDVSGQYITTKFYKKEPFINRYESIESKDVFYEFIKDYYEDVDELPDGEKKFSEANNALQSVPKRESQHSQYPSDNQTPRGHYVNVECSICHGYGRHNMIDCYRCEGYGWLEPGFGKRGNGTNDRTICDVCNGYKQRKCPAASVNLRKYVED